MNFDQATALLQAHGIEYSTQYEYRGPVGKGRTPHDLKLFTAVRLPFNAETWFELVTCEGEYYVGGCCGTTGVIQDQLNHIFRFESGWIKVEQLEDLAFRWESHDREDSYFTEEGWKKAFKAMPADLPGFSQDQNPWTVMAFLWHITKECFERKVPSAYGGHMSEMDKAISVLSQAFQSFSWSRLFDRHEKDPKHPFKANRAFMLSKIIPALKVFNDEFDKLDLGPVEGVALFDIEGDDIASNGYGFCIYETQKEAEDMLEQWRRSDDEHEERKGKPIDERICIRRCRVSKEEGIEWLE